MPLRRNRKQQGELAELAFLHKATSLGFIVSKPYGDSAPYDFVVGSGRWLRRVQIRSASAPCRGAYHLKTTRRIGAHHQKYTSGEIDVLVGYVPPEDAWYIFPLFAVSHATAVMVYPGRKHTRGRYERWRNRWDVLEGPRPRFIAWRRRNAARVVHPRRLFVAD